MSVKGQLGSSRHCDIISPFSRMRDLGTKFKPSWPENLAMDRIYIHNVHMLWVLILSFAIAKLCLTWKFNLVSMLISETPNKTSLIQPTWPLWTFKEQELDDQEWSWRTSSCQAHLRNSARSILETWSSTTTTDSSKSWTAWRAASRHHSPLKSW